MALPQLSNHDPRIRYYELMLEGDITGVPEMPLPPGFRFALYQPGDRDDWIAIEQSAKELSGQKQGEEVWEKYFGGKDEELRRRMVFVLNEQGEKVATATAFYDIYGRDQSGAGWLHWVAVRQADQGKGLAKPLIARVLSIMRSLGQTRAKIPTQTTTWLACKVYLDLGFRPIPKNLERNRDGWRIIRRLTDHPALWALTPADDREVLSAP